MAFIKCSGGWKLKETILWTNSSPSSNFSAQSVTLSSSIDNFDYIKFRYNAANYGTYEEGIIIIPVSILKLSYSRTVNNPLIYLTMNDSNKDSHARKISYESTTSLRIEASYKINGSFSATNRNIPLYIYGLK